MSRKKHTHQTKAEAHAEEAVLMADVATHGTDAGARATDDAKSADASGRLRRILHSAEELAKTRLQGTRAELMFDSLPQRLEQALDAVLDRVGLVRKSKLEGATRHAPSADAQPA